MATPKTKQPAEETLPEELPPEPAAEAAPAPREYKSVVLTIDHTSSRKDGEVVQKMVKSTQTVTASLLAILGYYQEKHLLHSETTIELLQEAGKALLPAFIYRSPENVQIIMAEQTYAVLINARGTLLEAEDFIINAAGEMLAAAQQKTGDAVPLMLFTFSADPEA